MSASGDMGEKEMLRVSCRRNMLKNGQLENIDIDESIPLRWRLHKYDERFGDRRNACRIVTFGEYTFMNRFFEIVIALKKHFMLLNLSPSSSSSSPSSFNSQASIDLFQPRPIVFQVVFQINFFLFIFNHYYY